MEAEICPNCEKVVYDAEGFPAGGVKNRLLLNFSLDQLENINYQLQKPYAIKILLHSSCLRNFPRFAEQKKFKSAE